MTFKRVGHAGITSCDITLIEANAVSVKKLNVELSRTDQSNRVTRELAQ